MNSWLEELGIVCALGAGKAAVAAALVAATPQPLALREVAGAPAPLPVGAVTQPLPELPASTPLTQRSRANQLLYAAALEIEPALRAALARHGSHRVGVVIGTSTSGIDASGDALAQHQRTGQFPADYHYDQQTLVSPATFLCEWLGVAGPCYVISTACTSGARALLSARRLLRLGVCDAVICGGVDALCELTLQGFGSLEAVSSRTCQPFSASRDGINIGEGAALFLMTRQPEGKQQIALLGGGASSDAHHISAPDPSGDGAELAMRHALSDARLTPDAIGYINLHGTATLQNDAMESAVTHRLFGADIPCSSTKPLTGHTLGAAGAIEAGFCWLTLSGWNPHRLLPPHHWDGVADGALAPLALAGPGTLLAGERPLMSNSFAFGGNNISLIVGNGAC